MLICKKWHVTAKKSPQFIFGESQIEKVLLQWIPVCTQTILTVQRIFQGLKERTCRKAYISINCFMGMVIPGKKHFSVLSAGYLWSICKYTCPGNLGVYQRQGGKQLCMFPVKNTSKWSTDVLIHNHTNLVSLAPLFPLLPHLRTKQFKTNGGSYTIALNRVNSTIPEKNNRTLNAFCSFPKLNHLDRAGISVWFLPCLVAERNILPWIRQTLSNQRCLDAVWNVIIFPFTSLAQFTAAHSILLYEAVLEKKQPHSLAEMVRAALWASFLLNSDNAQNYSAIQNSAIQPLA